MNNLPKLIALMGNRGAGKGAIASYLADFHHYTPRGFADPLYGQLAILNPWIFTGVSLPSQTFRRYNDLVAEYGVDYVKRNFVEVRKYLQLLGTECGREIIHDLVWVKIAEERSRGDYRTSFFDMRFANEVAWVRSQDSLLIRVTSPREDPPSAHKSEFQLDYSAEADFSIENDGTLQELYDKVEAVIALWQDEN